MDSQVHDIIQHIHEALQLTTAPVIYHAAYNGLELCVPEANRGSIVSELARLGVQTQSYVATDIIIDLSTAPGGTEYYYQVTNFRQRFTEAVVEKKNIAILDYNGGWLFYDRQAKINIINEAEVPGNYLVQNALAYFSFIKVLIGTDFADYFNTVEKEIVLYSSTKGIKRIQVPGYLPAIDETVDVGTELPQFTKRMQSPDFRIYFKNQLFDFSPLTLSTELQEMLGSLRSIMLQADNGLQLYLKNFSFDKLKSDLDKEKEKYFSSLRDILGKNLSQIVAIPISFAASVFATYKVNDLFILVIILVAYLAYSCFTYYLQSLYLDDIREIETDFTRDFQTLTAKSGLTPTQLEPEKQKIERRIKTIRSVISNFRLLLAGLSILFILFILYQISLLKLGHLLACNGAVSRMIFFILFK